MPLDICGCTAGFVTDLVGNPKDRFSLDPAPMFCLSSGTVWCWPMSASFINSQEPRSSSSVDCAGNGKTADWFLLMIYNRLFIKDVH